jgi:predicted dehydrogenase
MLKIGILGANELAKDHIRILFELKGQFEFIGFYDPNDELSSELIESFLVKRFLSYDELLDQVDCIDIVSPTIKHYEFASIALRKSKHIFIEKPLTQTIDEAKSLINLSREASVKVQIGSVERFNSAFLESLPFLNRPMLIETHRLYHHNSQNESSVVMDLMMNDIDVILSVVKSGVKKISASGSCVFSDSLDIVNARIEFDNGCVASLTASRVAQQKKCQSSFYQKESIVNIDSLLNELEVVSLDSKESSFNKMILSERPIIKEKNPKLEEFKSFYDAIKNDNDPIVSLANGYSSLVVAHKILELLNHSNIVVNDNI